MEDEEEVVYKGVDTFSQDYVGNAIWAWGLKGLELVDSLTDSAAGELAETYEGSGVVEILWDGRGVGRGREERVSEGLSFVAVGGD